MRSLSQVLDLPTIPHLRLEVTLRAEEPAMLPAFHGSMLRGAFGHALRRSVCSMGPAQGCETCTLRRPCIYTRIFESFVEGEPPPFLRGIDQAVRPYLFEPKGGAGRLEPGDPLRFDLLLFGQAVDLQAYAVLAIRRMAQSGLGSGRARFRLDHIEMRESPALQEAPLPDGPVTLRFVTPLRLKIRDQLADRFRFRDLAFHMLRRTLELAHTHVPGAPVDWSFQPLLRKADAVQATAADLRWHDWERWSQRQQTRMKLGGVVGTLTLDGDLSPFTSLLRTAEVIHVGKGTTFGLGKMEVLS